MLLGVLFLYRRLVAGWVLAGGDLQTYFFPYWTAAARAFQAGRLPLWNPDLFAGAPLLANSQAGVFYPLNWPLWLLSGSTLAGMARTLHWSVLLHLCLAALNAAWLARRLGLTRVERGPERPAVRRKRLSGHPRGTSQPVAGTGVAAVGVFAGRR